jgi:hypothetical protein
MPHLSIKSVTFASTSSNIYTNDSFNWSSPDQIIPLSLAYTRPPTYVRRSVLKSFASQSLQIRAYDEEAFELRNSHDRSLRLIILLRFGDKSPLNRVKDLSLSLSLRRGQWGFWSWLRGQAWLKVESRCLRSWNKRPQRPATIKHERLHQDRLVFHDAQWLTCMIYHSNRP